MSGLAGMSLRHAFPFRLLIGGEDLSFLLDAEFSFSNVDPGGFEAASFQVAKDLPQIVRGMPILLTSGLKTVWEGRVSQVQRSLGNQTQITGEGYAALLKDQEAAEIFVDRDLTKWQGPTTRRQIALIEAKDSPQSVSVSASPSGTPALVASFVGPWEAAAPPVAEGWYNAQGVEIGRIHYEWLRGTNVNNADTKWLWAVAAATNDLLGAFDASGNLRAAGPGGGNLTAGTGRIWGLLQFLYEAAIATSNLPYAIYWENVAVYGRHGLTERGGEPGGFYPWDIASWVERQVPGIQAGTITQDTSYIVPHYVQLAPVTLETILNDMAIQGAVHWGVWEAPSLTGLSLPRLDFRPRPALGEWTAYCKRQDCDTLDLREDLAGLYDKAIVLFSEVDGTQSSVTVTFPNPLLDQVNLERTVELNAGISTPAAAKQFGEQALELLYSQARVQGSATISTTIDNPSGPMPAWMLKAGIDRLRIGDMPSTDAFGIYSDLPISRVECAGSESGFTTTVEFGSGAFLTEALQARLATAATLAAVGG